MSKIQSFALATCAATFLFGACAAANSHGAEQPTKELAYVKNAAGKDIKSMNEPGVLAFFDDVISTNDPKAPLTCGMFRIEKSQPLKYNYDYDDTKIVLDGEITVTDGKNTVTAVKGDALMFPKGSTITFTTNSKGLAFACGQRKPF